MKRQKNYKMADPAMETSGSREAEGQVAGLAFFCHFSLMASSKVPSTAL